MDVTSADPCCRGRYPSSGRTWGVGSPPHGPTGRRTGSTGPTSGWDPTAGTIDAVTAALLADLARHTHHATRPDLTAVPAAVPGAVRIDRIAALERIRSAVAAAQHGEMVAFARSQVEAHISQVGAGSPDPAAVGRGVGDQIALAGRVFPFHGSRRLGVAQV